MQILSGVINKNYSTNNNSNSLTNNFNNYLNINRPNNDSNYNSERPSKKTNKNFNSNESNEFTANFSDIVNFEDINQIIKKPQTKENFISNAYVSNSVNIYYENKNANEISKKSSSKLEIGDLDVNENHFRNLNNFSQKHSAQQMRNSTITSGKNLSNVTSYSQNEKENNKNYENNSKICNNENTLIKPLFTKEAGVSNKDDIFEKLNLLKQRTKYVLGKYAESFGKKK